MAPRLGPRALEITLCSQGSHPDSWTPGFINPSNSKLSPASVRKAGHLGVREDACRCDSLPCRCNSLRQGLELLPAPTPNPRQGSTKVGRPPTPPRKPGSLFLSLGPLFPQSQSRKAGSSWLGGVELLLPCPSPTCQARLDIRVRGGTGMREEGTGQ